MAEIIIRENIPQYIEALKQWLSSIEREPLEDMAGFFAARLSDYEEHMSLWAEAYKKAAALVPADAKTLLDLGCGTGLELDALFGIRQDIAVTGIDLSPDMLAKLHEKHPQVKTRCEDYFQADLGAEQYDFALAFETLHHFTRSKKRELYRNLYRALKPGSVFLEVDYLAVCQEEERLLFDFCQRKRQEQGVPEDVFVHFDTPLTVPHERSILERAGFQVDFIDCIAGASFLWCRKE